MMRVRFGDEVRVVWILGAMVDEDGVVLGQSWGSVVDGRRGEAEDFEDCWLAVVYGDFVYEAVASVVHPFDEFEKVIVSVLPGEFSAGERTWHGNHILGVLGECCHPGPVVEEGMAEGVHGRR